MIKCPICRRLTSQYHTAKGDLVGAARNAVAREATRALKRLDAAKTEVATTKATLEDHQVRCEVAQ